jgi:hypothetical protein
MNVDGWSSVPAENLQNLDATKLRARRDLGKNSFESKEQLSALFQRFIIFSGPRGTRQKTFKIETRCN